MMGAAWEYHAIMWYDKLRMEQDPKMRVALAREIDKIRREYCPRIVTGMGSEMSDPYIFWYTHQAAQLEDALIRDRERLPMETPHG